MDDLKTMLEQLKEIEIKQGNILDPKLKFKHLNLSSNEAENRVDPRAAELLFENIATKMVASGLSKQEAVDAINQAMYTEQTTMPYCDLSELEEALK